MYNWNTLRGHGSVCWANPIRCWARRSWAQRSLGVPGRSSTILGTLGRSWAVSGRLGRSWSGLGAVLGRSWRGLGALLGGLGASWERLEPVLARLGAVLRAPRGRFRWSCGHRENCTKRCIFFVFLRIFTYFMYFYVCFLYFLRILRIFTYFFTCCLRIYYVFTCILT